MSSSGSRAPAARSASLPRRRQLQSAKGLSGSRSLREHESKSLHLHIGLADDLAPFRGLGANALGENLRCAYDWKDETGRQQFRVERGIAENLAGLRAELGNDLARRAFGRGQSVPGAGLVAGQPAL